MTNQICSYGTSPEGRQNPNDKNRSPLGFSALLTVLIIGVVALAMAYSASMLGLGELDLGYTAQKGGEAFAVADGCMEEAMRRIRLNASYGLGVGAMVLQVGNNSCTINVANPGGGQRNITVRGKVGDYYKKIQAVVTVAAQSIGNLNIVTINSWEERND